MSVQPVLPENDAPEQTYQQGDAQNDPKQKAEKCNYKFNTVFYCLSINFTLITLS